MRERTKNVYETQPLLTVTPSTEGDMSQMKNIQHLLEFDLSILDARQNAELQN